MEVPMLPVSPLSHTATMGCCCSSDYDEDWIENIDICEHCNYPIEPDGKRQVRMGWHTPTPAAKHPQRWPWHGQIPRTEGSRGLLSPGRG